VGSRCDRPASSPASATLRSTPGWAKLKLDYNEAAEKLGWVKPKAPAPAPPKEDLEGFIKRARAIAEHRDTSEDDRRSLEARIKTAETMRKAAREMERNAEALIREVFEGNEDITGQ
jgi:hypothetical protein